jgi:serine/threonine-protein kinase
MARQVAVLGPLSSDVATRAFLACEVVDDAPRADRPLVVVWIPDEVVCDPARMAQLQRETALVVNLVHPNLARVYGLRHFEEGWARLVEYTDGEPLRRIAERIREDREAVDPRVIGRIVADVCSGVHYAHQHGIGHAAGHPIVHGGLRPDTVIVSFSGATQVTGYGASALADAAPPSSGAGLDRRHYFAPEQILGGKQAAGVVTDVYGIGALMYELLTGRAPYRGASDIEQAVLTGDLAVPMLTSQGDALMNVALRALSRRGGDRFPSVLDLEQAVHDALGAGGIATEVEVGRLLEQLLPAEQTRTRQARHMLLDVAGDADAATILTASRDLPEIPGPSTMPPFPSGEPARAVSGIADTVPSVGVGVAAPSAPAAPAAAEALEEEPLPVPSTVPESVSVSPHADLETPWSRPSSSSDEGPEAAPEAPPDRGADAALAEALARPAGRPNSRFTRPLISEITHFDQRTGDGSRYAMWAVALAAVAGLSFIIFFPKAPVEGLAEPSSRKKLPPELVAAAMERAERAEHPDPTTEVTGATGAARIASKPPVDVFRGGTRLGRTPVTVALPVGRHELRLTDAGARINAYREVVVEEGELANLEVELAQFELAVTGPRGAEVFLNAERVDRLPVRPLRLYEGEYLVEVRYDGHRWSERIASAAGRRIDVAVETTGDGLVGHTAR